jgi:hypothetical protein
MLYFISSGEKGERMGDFPESTHSLYPYLIINVRITGVLNV